MKANTRRLLVVADASESAAASWTETQAVINRLLDQLDAQIVPEIGLLGTDALNTREQWRGGAALAVRPGKAPSLIAPVIKAARERLDEIVAVVVVGAGEVFDLADWARRPEAWYLLQTGDAPLAPAGSGPQNFAAGQLEQILSRVCGLQHTAITWPNPQINGPLGPKWMLDPAGYPMVFIPPLNGFMHLFPVLRAQFEAFLWQACPANWGDGGFGAYLSAAGPRVPAHLAGPDNYEGVLMGGALPEDVLAFQAWCGPAFRSPTDAEWLAAWRWLAGVPACVFPAALEDELAPAAREFWEFAFGNCASRTLLDLSFIRGGLIEWAKSQTNEWVGMGKPRQAHPFHNPLINPPLKPTSLTWRSKGFGFRLMRRAA